MAVVLCGKKGEDKGLDKILLLLPIVLLGILGYLLYYVLLSDKNINTYSIEGELEADNLFEAGLDLASIVLQFSHTNQTSYEVLSLQETKELLKKGVNTYKPIVNRLLKDPELMNETDEWRNEGRNEWRNEWRNVGRNGGNLLNALKLYSYFLNTTTSKTDRSVRILLEKPFKKRLNKILRKKRGDVKNGDRKYRRRLRNIYNGFLTKQSLNTGYKFVKRERKLLKEVEKEYAVDKEYLAAILYVETRFGKVTGKNSVFNVYNTLYHYDSKKLIRDGGVVRRFESGSGKDNDSFKGGGGEGEDVGVFSKKLNELKKGYVNILFPNTNKFFDINKQFVLSPVNALEEEGFEVLSKESYDYLTSYILKKQEWGYKQLKSLFLMEELYGKDIQNLKGSWAGAFGYPQFIPSSYMSYGVDGNKDGEINLFKLWDALTSIAHYLSEYGFKKGDEKRIRKSIYSYNYSTDYVDTVYKYANKLKRKKTGKKRSKLKKRRKRHKKAYKKVKRTLMKKERSL